MDCQFSGIGVYRADHDGIDQTVRKYTRQALWEPAQISGIHSYSAGSIPLHSSLQPEESSRIFGMRGGLSLTFGV